MKYDMTLKEIKWDISRF